MRQYYLSLMFSSPFLGRTHTHYLSVDSSASTGSHDRAMQSCLSPNSPPSARTAAVTAAARRISSHLISASLGYIFCLDVKASNDRMNQRKYKCTADSGSQCTSDNGAPYMYGSEGPFHPLLPLSIWCRHRWPVVLPVTLPAPCH